MDEPGASFLLESVEGGEQVGRYSFVGVNPRAEIALHDQTVTTTTAGGAATVPLADGQDLLDVLRAEMARHTHADLPGLPRFVGGAVGYFGYDVVRFFERLPATAERVLNVPDAIFLLADTLVVFDHARHRLILLANADLSDADGDVEAAYVEAIQRIDRLAERLLAAAARHPHAPLGRDGRQQPGGREQHDAGTV